MKIEDITTYAAAAEFVADVIIIGGGAAGITLAREFANTQTRVLLLESGGITETEASSALNSVESVGDPSSPAQIAKRDDFHKASAPLWSQDAQPYGVRCRGLGGSTQAWAGKSAPFDAIDFEARPWIAHSGWPICLSDLEPYIERAAKHLNLGPAINNAGIWQSLGSGEDRSPLKEGALRSYFWQFARSRIDPMDIMRFGPEFAREDAANVRVLLNATATQIFTDEAGKTFTSLEIAAPDGSRYKVTGGIVVLAASAIENARLLLASNTQAPQGLGNHSDQLGRYLMDHPGCRIASINDLKAVAIVHKYFGFYALSRAGGTYMYMHGLAIRPEVQAREGLANTALYMMEMRAPDDPWRSLKNLLKGQSKKPLKDLITLFSGSGLLINGLGRMILQHRRVPGFVKTLIVDLAIRINPQFAASEFQFGGVPHKLTGLAIDAIAEQRPDPENRITLSARRDRFGVPLARVSWHIQDSSRRDLARIGHLLKAEFARAGLPLPVLENWAENDRPEDAVIIDMAHTAGTTRMSARPEDGVVDPNGKVHGIEGLYVAGASVFPTSGHANPTLMICAMTIRLADHLKARIAPSTEPTPQYGKVDSSGPLVLVTGATGRIGRVLTNALLGAGFRVRGQYARAQGTDPRVDWVKADFRQSLDMDHLVENCQAVIHLAGELSDIPHMERVNVEATRALAEAARRNGVVYFGNASSMVVYGSPLRRRVDENAPVIDPHSPIIRQYYADPDMREYARTKVLGELAIREASAGSGMNVDMYRISVVADLMRLQETFQWGRGRRLFSLYRRTQYIYDLDLAAAIIHLLRQGLVRTPATTEVYNLADPSARSHIDVLAIARNKGQNRAFRPSFHVPVVMDIAKAAAKYKATHIRYPIGMIDYRADKLVGTGFKPVKGFTAAIDEAAEAFTRNSDGL